jgi:hypothetical protein
MLKCLGKHEHLFPLLALIFPEPHLPSLPQMKPGRNASYRRYRSVPQALISKLMSSNSSVNPPIATATILWWDSDRNMMCSGQSQQGQWEGQLVAFTAVYNGRNLPMMELSTDEPSISSDTNQTDLQHRLGSSICDQNRTAVALAQQPSGVDVNTQSSESLFFLDCTSYEHDMALLRSLFARGQAQEQGAPLESTPFLRAQSDPTSMWPAEVSGIDGSGFTRTVSGSRMVDDDSGADAAVVRNLLEAYVWHTTETSTMLQSMLYQVDWAIKRCSSASVMFTRSVPLNHSLTFTLERMRT